MKRNIKYALVGLLAACLIFTGTVMHSAFVTRVGAEGSSEIQPPPSVSETTKAPTTDDGDKTTATTKQAEPDTTKEPETPPDITADTRYTIPIVTFTERPVRTTTPETKTKSDPATKAPAAARPGSAGGSSRTNRYVAGTDAVTEPTVEEISEPEVLFALENTEEESESSALNEQKGSVITTPTVIAGAIAIAAIIALVCVIIISKEKIAQAKGQSK